jgi:hypothetical protein
LRGKKFNEFPQKKVICFTPGPAPFISTIFAKAVLWKPAEKLQQLKDLMTLHSYLSAHNHRDIRGTASETEVLERAIYRSHGIHAVHDPKKLVDLEAFANPMLSVFAKSYDQMTQLLLPQEG